MPKYLIILESPEKARKVASFLGSEYDVTASVGHIADLPVKKLSVDIRNNFKPTYEVNADKKQVVKNIVRKAKKADIVYLMTDGDREGEGISFHISEQLPKETNCKRAITYSITKTAVLQAIAAAGEIDQDMVASYETRRILDRLVGYKCSWITKQATGGPSAGRVQSAALRILAEREREIRGFVPVVYWPIEAELLTERKEKILASIKSPKPLDIKTQDQAEKIIERLKQGPVKVSKFEKKESSSKAYAPFTTSEMIQAASAVFGWKEDRTMKTAQSLYQSGLITYHRSDSRHIIPLVVQEIRQEVLDQYGSNYALPQPNVFANKKMAQEAHEAIRPTEIVRRLAGHGDEGKLYQMIWKRTVASQMANMRRLTIVAEFSCDDYLLGANGHKTLFDGWRKCWDYGTLNELELPEMTVGEVVDVMSIKTEKKETQPPPRFTGASFNKQLEKAGIGRPATYASIPQTLEARGYIERKKSIHVTDLGLSVEQFLREVNFCFIDLNFTADMESKLDKIAAKQANKLDVLNDFWARLRQDLDNANKHRKEAAKSEHQCPECHAFLVVRHSKYGSFYSCENYGKKDINCTYKAKIADDGTPIVKAEVEKTYSDIPCPKCKARLVVRHGKRGEFLGCEKFAQGCEGLYDMEGNEIVFNKKRKSPYLYRRKKSKKKT